VALSGGVGSTAVLVTKTPPGLSIEAMFAAASACSKTS
jgi:hypothetical protein